MRAHCRTEAARWLPVLLLCSRRNADSLPALLADLPDRHRELAVRVLMIMLLSLAFASPLRATSPTDFKGTWVFKLGDRNLFVLRLAGPDEHFTGVFERPAHLLMNGSIYSMNDSLVSRSKVIEARLVDGKLSMTVVDESKPESKGDRYVLSVTGDRALLSYADVPPGAMPPWKMERASTPQFAATDWQPNRLYVAGDSDVSSPGMRAIYDADQAERQTANIDWPKLSKADSARRENSRKLLDAGALHTGEDFEKAAFVFQHGNEPDDYLLAHTLAMIATTKGRPSAIWIASASLDRYLQATGRKQIYGTQFMSVGKLTQKPYDRALVSDRLRAELGVPPIAAQLDQLKAMQSESKRR